MLNLYLMFIELKIFFLVNHVFLNNLSIQIQVRFRFFINFKSYCPSV